MPTHLHHLTLALPGTFAGATVTCLADDTALCRRWCIEGCEEACGHTPLPVDAELVAMAPLDGHRWGPTGSCSAADWINACGVEDSHVDGDGFPFDDDGGDQVGVRSGPVDVSWNGDDYVWAHAAPDPGIVVPGPGQLAFA